MTILAILKGEARRYRALWLWLRGRNFHLESDAVIIASNRGTGAMPLAFAVATVIEVVVLHLLLPWVWLQVTLAIVSVWSLVTLFGYLAAHRTNPHYLTDSSLVLRRSGSGVAVIDRGNIATVTAARAFAETAPTIVGERLFLPNADGTNVDIKLRSAELATLPSFLQSSRLAEPVTRISLYVDDPKQLISMLREQSVTE